MCEHIEHIETRGRGKEEGRKTSTGRGKEGRVKTWMERGKEGEKRHVIRYCGETEVKP